MVQKNQTQYKTLIKSFKKIYSRHIIGKTLAQIIYTATSPIYCWQSSVIGFSRWGVIYHQRASRLSSIGDKPKKQIYLKKRYYLITIFDENYLEEYFE